MDEMSKPLEEIYLARRKTHVGYDIAHIIPGNNNSHEQLHFMVTLGFYEMVLYLRGACLGKDSKILKFYNGMPDAVKEKCTVYSLSKSKMYPLKEKHLEKLLSRAELKEEFRDKVETIEGP